MIRSDLRADRDCCYSCGALLANAPVFSRSWCKIRSGEWIGSRGEYVTLRCGCGRRVRLLWAVNIAPWQERTA